MLGIIMAGGKGTRLHPLTENKPKPLVNVLGMPVIDYVKNALIKTGVNEIIVTTGYKGQGLQNLVNTWDMNLHTVCSVNEESTPMGTAGSVKLLEDKLTQTFIVASGDAILSSDLSLIIDAHKTSNAKVTMALWEVDDPTQFGIVGLSKTQGGEVDGSLNKGYISKFLEKPKQEEAFSNVINAGLYIIEPEVMKYIPKDTKYDFSKELFPHLLKLGYPLFGIKLNGVWFDVGTPKELIKAQNHLVKNSKILPFDLPDGHLTPELGYIIGNSKSASPIFTTVVCEDSIVGKNSNLVDSLVMNGAKIGDNCKIIESIIGENVTIGDSCELFNCVIGDNVTVDTCTILNDQKVSST